MSQVKSDFSSYSRILRNVLMSTTSDAATKAVRSHGFRASLVQNPLNDQVEIGKTLVTLRERSSRA